MGLRKGGKEKKMVLTDHFSDHFFFGDISMGNIYLLLRFFPFYPSRGGFLMNYLHSFHVSHAPSNQHTSAYGLSHTSAYALSSVLPCFPCPV
jgi:hypothetical protein